ncbi:MAG: hypothetical protein AAFQ68_12530 [Bacteroidota bacterium]
MESKNEFDVSLAIERYVGSLCSSAHLSETDFVELSDHLHNEVEDLQQLGLSAEEALMVGQKRLGTPKLLRDEYAKARPWRSILPLLVPAIVIFFGIKSIFNLMKIVGMSSFATLAPLMPDSLTAQWQWIDLALQGGVFVLAIALGAKMIRRYLNGTLFALWPIPLVFLFSELGIWATQFLTVPMISPANMGLIYLNSSYLYLGLSFLAIVLTMGIILRHRDLRYQLA